MKTYKILYAKNVEYLAEKVNRHIKAGFICQGGVTVAMAGESAHQKASIQIAQAMTYEKKETK